MSDTTTCHDFPPNVHATRTVGDSAPPFARKLRVTHISTTDLRGGAARAAHRLHRVLRSVDVRSDMLVAQRFSNEADIVEYNPFAPAPAVFGHAFFRLSRRWHRPPVSRAGGYFSPDWSFTGWRLSSQVPGSDVINLHWVADLLDYRTLPKLTAQRPVVWTFHDMNAFTGGCHYSGICERFTERCGSCPQLMTTMTDIDMTRRVLERKHEALKRVPRARLAVVCPSEWLAREARRSGLFREFDVRVIPNGLDVHEFRPMDRAEARSRLRLPQDARIVLFVADLIADRRKGLRFLLKAFEAIQDIPNLLLVTLGRGRYDALGPGRAQHLGSLDASDDLRAAYSAADAFAMPSLQDNLPNTILEAMACGTPVVGFAAGGVGEAVRDGQTGLLAPTGDHVALAAALRRVLEDRPLQQRLAHEARACTERDYDIALQAKRYAAFYREMLERSETAAAQRTEMQRTD